MSSAARFLGFIAISFWLLILGCDRTVQSKAQPKANNGDGDSSLQASVAGDTPKDKTSVDPSLIDHTPPMHRASEDTPSGEELPSANSDPSEKQVEEKVYSLEVKKSDDPVRMLEYLEEIDRSIEQLLLAQKQMEAESVRENGVKLAKMKLLAAKHLSSLPSATQEQVNAGTKAQLVALSHLSGLKDVQAAKQLEALAKQLLENPDRELRQQGQVVLFGFAVQNLQNGVISDPQQIVEASKALVANEQYRGRVEMTSLQHAMNALAQMGYHEQISQLQRIAFDAFSNSTDQPLRHEAWNRLVANSAAQLEFMSSLEPLGTPAFDSQISLNAAKKLITDFPNAVTLEMLATTVPSIEYAGQAEFSAELSNLIAAESSSYTAGVSASAIQAILAEHKQRMSWIGRPIESLDVVDMDGQPLALADLAGKVVLVNFGLTWDLNCMKELQFIQRAYDDLHASGFEVLYISMDGDLQQLQKSVKQNAKPWKTYRSSTGDARGLTQQFGITMFPHMMLVGRDGKVAFLHVRGERIATQAKQLLSQ